MKLSIVIVTFNRLEKLKKAISLYEQQTINGKIDYRLIVVNNCSTDGTTDFLNEWGKTESPFEKVIINTESNLGGAGGFYTGEKKALELGSDWVFVADDDAYPHKDMIEKFIEYQSKHDCSNISAICAAVYKPNETVDLAHRLLFKKLGLFKEESKNCPIEFFNKDKFEFDLLSYVGPFINSNALKKVGLIEPKYFIYSDDTEHSLRLKKYGKIICVPCIKITHEAGGDQEKKPNITTWREYYLLRNRLNMHKRHHKLVALYAFIAQFRRLYLTNREKGERRKMLRTAFWDAYLNRLGKHKIYKPGWQIEE